MSKVSLEVSKGEKKKKIPLWSCQTSNHNKHQKVMYRQYMHDCVGPHVMFTCGRMQVDLTHGKLSPSHVELL